MKIKNTHEDNLNNGRFKKGCKPWNTGLTAKLDKRVKMCTDKAHKTTKERYRKGEIVAWNKGGTVSAEIKLKRRKTAEKFFKENPEYAREICRMGQKKGYESKLKKGWYQSEGFRKVCKNIGMKNKVNTKKSWQNERHLFNIFKGQLFGKDYVMNEFDKEIIRTRVRLFKIQHNEVINEQRQADGN